MTRLSLAVALTIATLLSALSAAARAETLIDDFTTPQIDIQPPYGSGGVVTLGATPLPYRRSLLESQGLSIVDRLVFFQKVNQDGQGLLVGSIGDAIPTGIVTPHPSEEV
jgi:hypothetical protein